MGSVLHQLANLPPLLIYVVLASGAEIHVAPSRKKQLLSFFE